MNVHRNILVFAGAVVIVEKKKLAKRLLICVVCTALAFGTRTLLVKSYNLVFNGYFINNTFGSVPETKIRITAGRIKLLPAVLYTPSSCTAP